MPASETPSLPEDPARLKALLRAALAERDRERQRAAEQEAVAQEKSALAGRKTQRADALYLENRSRPVDTGVVGLKFDR